MKNNTHTNLSDMNEVKFRNFSATDKVGWLNLRLQETGKTVEEVAKEIGIPSSSISSLMKEAGHQYSRSAKQYLPKEQSSNVKSKKVNEQEFIEYLLMNREALQNIIEDSTSKQLIFDDSIYRTDDTFMSKSVKVKTNTLNEFQQLLKDKFPQFRFQDMLTQALIDFIKKYK